MARPYRRLRKSVVIAICLGFAVALPASSSTQAGGATMQAGGATTREPFRVLQMNLCDSGIAECYTGRSVARAATVIRADRPNVVTLNEVCQGDVAALRQALASVASGAVVSAFEPATDRRTDGAFRCRNGEPYGIGVIAQIPTANAGYSTHSGIYPTQDPNDPEERAWLCLDAIGNFYACTTHLANLSPSVALAQCGFLLRTAIPQVRARHQAYQPTVVGGDLNLGRRGSPDVESCVPSGYLREGDGGVQYVVATTDFMVMSDTSIEMDGTTDHPGLLVALTTSGTRAGSDRQDHEAQPRADGS